jgi:hypothetical protein
MKVFDHQVFLEIVESHRYYRIFGELHLDDQEVSHTKDEFLWDDSEYYEFLE